MKFSNALVAILLSLASASPIVAPAICESTASNAPQYQVSSPSDTDTAFLANTEFSDKATGATTPADFQLIPGFQNVDASAGGSSYLTMTTTDITEYDPSICAVKCIDMPYCYAFNICKSIFIHVIFSVFLIITIIVFERDPSIVLSDSTSGCSTTSTSVTNIICTFFSAGLTSAAATNNGQVRYC
jgi:hypothetical protein